MAAGMDRCRIDGGVSLVKRTEPCRLRLVVGQAVDVKAKCRHRSLSARIVFGDHAGDALGPGNELRICPLRDGALHFRRFLLVGRADQVHNGVLIDHLRPHQARISQPREDLRNACTGADLTPAILCVLVKFSSILYKLIHRKFPLLSVISGWIDIHRWPRSGS